MSTRKFPSQFTQKVTPVNADKLMIADSANSDIVKYITFADVQWPQWIGITWRWAYSWATAYSINDTVSYTNWLSYICILASTGNVPTNATYWAVILDAAVATESSKWPVRLSTTTDVNNGTDTESGEPLVVQPSMLKTTNDNLDTEKLKIKSKVDVVVATTANITLSWTQTIDWVAVTAGQRVLVKDQSTASQNGIYLCAAWAWTRVTDFDTNVNNEVDLWAWVWVQWGTVSWGMQYSLTTTWAITVGTTALVFTRTYPAAVVPWFISSVALTTPLTVPATCNVILIEATAADAAARIQKWDIILTRTGKTTGSIQWAETNGVNNTPWVACSWSGSTLTTTLTWTTLWGTVYYYTNL